MMKLFGRLFLAIVLFLSLAIAPGRATVSSQVNKTIALGNGVATSFAFSFVGVAAAYISVILTDSAGNETVLSQGSGPTQYQISLNPPVTGAIWGVGGTVTYNPSGTPIPSGSTLTIFRTLPLTQAISLQNQNSLTRLGNGAETGLDTATMQIQQTAETLARAIKAPIVDATPPADLPPIAQRANKGAAFDGSGNLVAGALPSSGVISSAMQPVVDAATLALGRAAFGLGNIAVENIGQGLEDDGTGSVRVNSTVVAQATNYSVTAADHQKRFEVTGPITFMLTRSLSLWNGFQFSAKVLTGGALTLAPDVNDSIGTAASGISIPVPPGASFTISTNGLASGTWQVDIAQADVASPGGYLSTQSGTPVILGDDTSATVYYNQDKSGYVPIFNGAFPVSVPFGTLSASLATGYAASTAYDFFVTISGGQPILVSGPAWRNTGQPITGATNASPIVITANSHGLVTGDEDFISGVQGNTAANGKWTVTVIDANTYSLNGSTGTGAYTAGTGQHAARGKGSGTTDLTRASPGGFLVNTNAMTARNGASTFSVAAGQATYVASIFVDASGNTVTCHRSFGQSRIWGVFNAYNRKPIRLQAGDGTANWTYNTAAIRSSNNNTNNSLRMMLGLAQEEVLVQFAQEVINVDLSTSSTGKNTRIGIGWNGNTAFSGLQGSSGLGSASNATSIGTPRASLVATPALGGNLFYMLEQGNATAGLTTTFNGTISNMLMTAEWNG